MTDKEATDIKQAIALIEADKKAREEEALKEIEAICKLKRVTLVPVIALRGLEGTHNIEVKALD